MERFPPCAATLQSIEPVARDTFVYTFATERPMPFQAGQFFNLAVPGAKPRPERSYSCYSDPDQPSRLEFCIKLLEGGAASEMLRVAKVGDTHTLKGPYGVFKLAMDDDPVVFVATATGIAPYRAMLKVEARERRARRYRVYFGVRDVPDLFMVEELEEFKRTLPSFDYTLCLSRAEGSFAGFHGRVTAAVARDYPYADDAPRREHFYLCGNGPMIDETRDYLLGKGLDRKRIHYEKYY